jgi:glycosyltransferase involved in cell wall biosynthesis
VKVLYTNHTAEVSGGERSLLLLLEGLQGRVTRRAAVPRGRLAGELEALDIPVETIAGTAGSLRLHPRHTPRALAEMAVAATQVRRSANRHRIDLVHANSIRAGVVLALAHLRAPRRATVVHVRDCLPPGNVSSATMRLIAATATTVVANSHYTARSVLAMAPDANVEVLHNPVDVERWDPARIDRDAARARLGTAGERTVLLGVLAQLSPWKGQDTAIEALRLLREEGIDAHLLLIGSAKFVARATRFDNEAFLAGLHARVAQHGLAERVSWLGEREDAPELVRALDVLLLPSLEEPFGRALIEAMALEVPVLATSVGGPAEIVRDGQEGYLLPPREPAAWAQAVRLIVERPDRGREMGGAGRRRVLAHFTAERHAGAMLELYERALGHTDA